MRDRVRSVVITAAVSAVGCILTFGAAGCSSTTPLAPESPPATEPASNPTASDGATAATPPASASAQTAPIKGAAPAIPLGYAQTSDERRAALDKRLNESLSSFDARLRSEQQKIAQERDAHHSTVATVSNSDGGNDDTGRRSASGSKRDADKSKDAGELKSDKTSGNTGAPGNGAVAKEVPDGNDDDVIARRLRKAAEQETDPELKEKLWKEYVEYKKNTGT